MVGDHASGEQMPGWRRVFHGRSAAAGRHSVRPNGELPDNNSAVLPASAASAIPLLGLCFKLAVFNASRADRQVACGGRSGRRRAYDAREGYT